MQKDQKSFIVMGYSFLKARQIDAILQEIMAVDWYSQWLPQQAVTVHAEMRTSHDDNRQQWNDTPPATRAIHFSLTVDKTVDPDMVTQLIAAFSKAFIDRMRAMPHEDNPDSSHLTVLNVVNLAHAHEARKRQPGIIEWESYPIKSQVRFKKH